MICIQTIISFKQFLEESVEWTEHENGSGPHDDERYIEHLAKIGNAKLRITHTLGMSGNHRTMNVSFHHDKDSEDFSPHEKYQMLHTVKASVKHMIKKHHVNRLTWGTGSPVHEHLYDKFAKSIKGDVKRDPFGRQTVDLP